ncbi:GTP-binding protein, partial [Sphingobacterium shayense]|uniref:GTP-binding protein n=1 Tax=Sphingobacterium shayense TaxID=626343 RepID=UPI00155348E2
DIRNDLLDRWHPEWEDRKNELVFIGQNLDKETCIEELERCLLTEEEASGWRFTTWTDEFPENF